MADFTFSQQLRYRFDNFMSRGGSSIFIGLVIMFLSALLIIGLLRGTIALIDPDGAERYVQSNELEDGQAKPSPHGNVGYQVGHQFYQVFNHLSDPGTMAYDIDSSPFYFYCPKLSVVI